MLRHVKETRKAVRAALSELEKKGWYIGNPSKPGIWCCGSCSWGNVPEDADNAVLWSEQQEDNFKRWGTVYIHHKGHATDLVDALHQQGVIAQWNGSEYSSIKVSGLERHLDYGQNNWEEC